MSVVFHPISASYFKTRVNSNSKYQDGSHLHWNCKYIEIFFFQSQINISFTRNFTSLMKTDNNYIEGTFQ